MGLKYNTQKLGVLLGLIAPSIAFGLFYVINFSHMPFESFITKIKLAHIYTPLISLCVIANLPTFFGFIWTERYYSARGVLLSTFLYAGLVVFLKYFT
ncbi:MAG: hypothetical protein J0M08_03450 [Bacteroidetes bacterium]|nr:hypothetical protein [Bacteroidota bacterium]